MFVAAAVVADAVDVSPYVTDKSAEGMSLIRLASPILEKSIAQPAVLVRRTDFKKLKTLGRLGIEEDSVMRGHERLAHRGGHGIPRDPVTEMRHAVEDGRVIPNPLGDVVNYDAARGLGHAH